MIQNLLVKLIPDKLILALEFQRRFNDYEFPFDKADSKIMKMNPAVRMRYYNDARELNNNTAFNGELEELVRTYYQKLAVKTLTQSEVEAHRLTLIAINEFKQRITKIGSLYHPPSVTNQLENL